jgi:hypothetical protein
MLDIYKDAFQRIQKLARDTSQVQKSADLRNIFLCRIDQICEEMLKQNVEVPQAFYNAFTDNTDQDRDAKESNKHENGYSAIDIFYQGYYQHTVNYLLERRSKHEGDQI